MTTPLPQGEEGTPGTTEIEETQSFVEPTVLPHPIEIQEGTLEQGSVHDEPEERNDEQQRPEHATWSQSGPSTSTYTPSVRSEVDAKEELAEMRKWLEKTKQLEELRTLREARARYDAGDPNALRLLGTGGIVTNPYPQAPSSSLPRPEPPQTYAKRNRTEYNRWERDCEGYFTSSPINFRTEQQKVDFGVRYISEPLKTLWRAHCMTEQLLIPLWMPTWLELKTVMLNSLGTPQERRQTAYEHLKNCHQRQGQSPTELLDYMRPLWEELGTAHTPELQVIEYTAALRPEIQKDLYLLPVERRSTLPQVEEQANVIHRRRGPVRGQHPQGGKSKGTRPRGGSDGSEGERKPLKKARRPHPAHFAPKRYPKPHVDVITCFRCGAPGHRSYECTQPKKEDKKPLETVVVKGKGPKG
jgi:hypothetical protein